MDIKEVLNDVWDYLNLPSYVEEFLLKSVKTFTVLFPNTVIKLNLELLHGDQFLNKLGKAKGVVSHEQYLKMDYVDNIHELQAFKLQEGFTFVRHKIQVMFNMQVHRKNPAENNLFEFVFPHPDTTHTVLIDSEEKILGKGTLIGGLWTSPNVDFRVNMQKGSDDHIISIVLDREVMNKVLNFDTEDGLKDLIQSQKEFLILEESDTNLDAFLRMIFNHSSFNLAGMMELEGLVKLVLARFLQKILTRINSSQSETVNTHNMDRALEAKRLIIENITSKPNIEDLAKKMSTNRVTLQKEFQSQFGVSIYQYYLNARLEKAKKLLDDGSLNVSEVGERLGYLSISQFSKSFLKKYGCNPSEYKSQ
ncbi:MAG: AraC family transcriptional regulator [Fibrobacterales bacterium]